MMRLLTALSVLLLCAFAAFRGWEVTGFAAAEANPGSAQGAADAFAAWHDAPGIASAAREAALHRIARGRSALDNRNRIRALDQLLAVRTLSSTEWLALAGARVVTNAPQPEVISALTMSYLTGPNEATIMFDRALFGLLQWNKLPGDIRERTARDLGGVMLSDAISGSGFRILKSVLDGEPPETRSELSEMLEAERVSEKQLGPLGL